MNIEKFLNEYEDLGNRLQLPQQPEGIDFLPIVGKAMRQGRKLQVKYRKYSDEDAYDAVLQPYCLKLFQGRWYLLAVKENSSHPESRFQTFAIDRFDSIGIAEDSFTIDPNFDADEYFCDSFGIWVDKEKYPVKDITIAVTRKVANYLRSLPLHHSQRQLEVKPDQSLVIGDGDKGEAIFFQYHISPTPDFLAELRKWDKEIIIMNKV